MVGAFSGDTVPQDPQLVRFGADHIGALLVIALVGTSMILVARRGRYPRLVRGQSLALAALLVTAYPAKLLARVLMDLQIGDVVLPMHLCDWAALAGFVALVWNSERAKELTYFWGIAGTLQGLITPAIHVGFPHLSYLGFFQLHGGVVIAALYLPLGLGWRPARGAVWRVFLFGQVYLLVSVVVNWRFGTNYAFLRTKPPSSLLDYLGPWPFYVLAYEVLALVLFTALYLPFLRAGGSRR